MKEPTSSRKPRHKKANSMSQQKNTGNFLLAKSSNKTIRKTTQNNYKSGHKKVEHKNNKRNNNLLNNAYTIGHSRIKTICSNRPNFPEEIEDANFLLNTQRLIKNPNFEDTNKRQKNLNKALEKKANKHIQCTSNNTTRKNSSQKKAILSADTSIDELKNTHKFIEDRKLNDKELKTQKTEPKQSAILKRFSKPLSFIGNPQTPDQRTTNKKLLIKQNNEFSHIIHKKNNTINEPIKDKFIETNEDKVLDKKHLSIKFKDTKIMDKFNKFMMGNSYKLNKLSKDYNSDNKLTDKKTQIITTTALSSNTISKDSIKPPENKTISLSMENIEKFEQIKEGQSIAEYIKTYYEEHKEFPKTIVSFYRIGRLLGRGAFGKVNLGMSKLTGKLIAVKSIKKEYLTRHF